jgi:Leucine-rich repeat (LRR) protein
MEKNLPMRQNTQVALRKAKSLIGTTDRILAKRETRLATSDDGWIQRLWDWADENNVPDRTWVAREGRPSGGYWTGLPREKEQLLNLTVLDLRSLKLTTLPPEIGNLTELEALDLRSNHLTKILPEIGNLIKLKSLELDRNYLTEISPEIGNLKKLEVLMLGFNRLTEIPPEIGSLTELEALDLRSNHLTKIPPEIRNLREQLVIFTFSNNPLSNLST